MRSEIAVVIERPAREVSAFLAELAEDNLLELKRLLEAQV